MIFLLVPMMYQWVYFEERLSSLEKEKEPQTELYRSPGGGMPAVGITSPGEFEFCGEKVPLDDPDVRERFEKELYINCYWHSQTALIMKRANRWFPMIEEILEEEGIHDDFKYVAAIESGLENLRSYAGAIGYWQIMPKTGKELGLEINSLVDERYDPVRATRAACKFVHQAQERFDNYTLTAASYNRGQSGIARALSKQKVESFYDLKLNDQTSRYIFRILAFKEIMQNPEKYHFRLSEEELYKPPILEMMRVDTTVRNLVDFAQDLGVSYKTLRYYNPWLRGYRLPVRGAKAYEIRLPVRRPKMHTLTLWAQRKAKSVKDSELNTEEDSLNSETKPEGKNNVWDESGEE